MVVQILNKGIYKMAQKSSLVVASLGEYEDLKAINRYQYAALKRAGVKFKIVK